MKAIPSSDDKENAITISQNPPKSQNSLQKPPPSTPATRLPLADLIGDTESQNASRAATALFSPQDHVQWNIERSPQSPNPKTNKRKRSAQKRARSSSPPSSSSRSASKHIKRSAKIPPDLQDLKKSLKTPQADPVAELWNRYTCASSKDTPLGPQIAALAEFTSSSPYADGNQASNVRGLRRWTSCGVEWPSAKVKRRKLQHVPTTLSNIEDAFVDPPERSQHEDIGREKSARITTLLDRISEDLVKSRRVSQEDTGPSSSSPLPQKQEGVNRDSISPLRAGDLASKVAEKSPASQTKNDISQRGGQNGPPPPANDPSSSTFGSEGLDSELFSDEGQAIQVGVRSQEPSQEVEMGVETHANVDSGELGRKQMPGCPPPQPAEELDEFGDDELCAADFEAVASLNDETRGQKTSSTLGRGDETMPSVAAEADEFGEDDIDEESFAAAEASATQSLNATDPGSKRNVCSSCLT